jgi:hypothetical protein
MKLEILTNQEFGKWKVLYRVECSRSTTKWKCECKCGIIKDVYASHLKSGDSQGCSKCFTEGNKGKGHKQFAGYEGISKTFWSDIQNGASGKKGKRTPVEFSITIEFAWNLYVQQNNKCALSGIPLHMQYRSNRYKSDNIEHTASLDRIDSSKGYIEGNVQWVHKDINMMKRTYDQGYFIEMCRKVANNV